jgi:NAD-dependent SIR2 family protein deacetylase
VGALDTNERNEIVRKTLWEYGKKLDERQMKQLLSKQEAYKPLYLIIGTCCAMDSIGSLDH